MNILRILTLNKHGDFQEVLFSSALSYLLDPNQDHRLGPRLLERIVKGVFPDIDQGSLESAKVEPERTLGSKGNVDLLITMGDKVLAIEVKIWDRSARNISRKDEHQVERYCKHLAKEFKNKDWQFIFLIPTSASPKCINEFKTVCMGELSGNVKLMTWIAGDPIEDKHDIPESNVIQESIYEMISGLMDDIPRVDLTLNTQWLIDSLIEIIPSLEKEIPEPGRFPNRDSMQDLPTWHIFQEFFKVGGRWPISLHSTVGIPYGLGNQRTELHGNSLYRIRTVSDYYSEINNLAKYLPENKFEIECWPDVYEECKEGIHAWLEEIELDKRAIRNDYHLDATKQKPAVIISLPNHIQIDEGQVSRFNHIVKEGFRMILRGKEDE